MRITQPYFQFQTTTYANLPSAVGAGGQVFRITDKGVSGLGLIVISDGAAWYPVGDQLIGRVVLDATVTGTLTETALATITVPYLPALAGLKLLSAWTVTNNGNSKTLRARFGGASGTAYLQTAQTAVVGVGDSPRRIRNRNSTSSQIGGMSTSIAAGASSGVIVTSAIDTTVPQDVVFTGQLGNIADSIALNNCEVWMTQ